MRIALIVCGWLFLALPLLANPDFPGGSTSVNASGKQAFSQPAANLSFEDRLTFSVGNSFFRNPWVMAPASTDARDGLGPLFNTNACQNCHIRDGRGHAPEEGQKPAVSLLLRLSVPARSAEQQALAASLGVVPEPNYGTQLQDFAVNDVPAEGQIQVRYHYQLVKLADGEEVQLRTPQWQISELAYGPLAEDVMLSARVAPPMIGLGLLASISDDDLLRREQQPPAAHISGRVNRLGVGDDAPIGRFGWKAGSATLLEQNAAAFLGDLGLTTSLFKQQNCTAVQRGCMRSVHGGEPEVSDNILQQVTFYTAHLAVPKRRNRLDPQVQQGEVLFKQLGCEHCHQASWQTAADAPFAALANQRIYPYSDLLLHDMGDGLADNRSEFLANGREWRTPPLWGIGLLPVVNGHQQLLHDGRARNVLEAILWHGGEAQQSRDAVIDLTSAERAALITFINSL